MCGIAGLFATRGNLAHPPRVVEAMCQQIVHRGPDDRGTYCHAIGHIGMQRLSIIDISTGHQPIHNEDQTIWIVFNGEIYNFQELRKTLEGRGHRFYTHTDTECIVHGYEEWGENVFEQLRGMFGIAILDLNRQRLVLGRDRLGKKPLYYTVLPDGTLAFGSELKCLTVVPGFERRVSAQATHDYFVLGYVPAPASIFEGVFKLPPAHYLVAERGTQRLQRYWNLSFGPKWGDDTTTLKARLRDALEDAVRVRLVSDVPFGAFLSGGLDSSVVAALMARNLRHPVKTFSIGFREERFNELPAARAVAKHIGAEHTELIVEADAVSALSDLVWYFDEPFGDSSALPTFLVSKLARPQVKMVLTGDGGDELFAGYQRYAKYLRLRSLRRASFGLAAPVLHGLAHVTPNAIANRLRRIASRLQQPFPDIYISGVALSGAGDLRPLLNGDFWRNDPYQSIRHHFISVDRADDLIDKILGGDIATYLTDDILVKVDRMTMANSLEARAPLLDHRLLEFSARLPTQQKIKNGVGKQLFREIAAELIPPILLNKPKQGFAIPIAQWLRSNLRQITEDTLSSKRFRERGIVDPKAAEALYKAHLTHECDNSEILWLILTHELWAQTFLDGNAPSPSPLPARTCVLA